MEFHQLLLALALHKKLKSVGPSRAERQAVQDDIQAKHEHMLSIPNGRMPDVDEDLTFLASTNEGMFTGAAQEQAEQMEHDPLISVLMAALNQR